MTDPAEIPGSSQPSPAPLEDPWTDESVWVLLATDPRLDSVTQTLIVSALTLYRAGDLLGAEDIAERATPGCVVSRDQIAIGAAHLLILAQVGHARIPRRLDTIRRLLEMAQSLLPRQPEMDDLAATTLRLVNRLLTTFPEPPTRSVV